MKIADIRLVAGLGETLSVAVIQLKSPFDDELERGSIIGQWSLVIGDDTASNYIARLRKLHTTLKWISTSLAATNIIVLPEYCFIKEDQAFDPYGKGTLDVLKEFCANTGAIIVGNYYTQEKRQSISFVLIPARYIDENASPSVTRDFFIPKMTVTAEEDDFARPAFESGSTNHATYRFWWTAGPTQAAYFQVITCKDYLFFTSVGPLRKYPEMINIDHPGLILAPLCTPEMQTFESRATAMLRDVPSVGTDGALVTVFANATSVPGQAGPIMAGRSQIVSPIDLRTEVKPVIERNAEGVIWATVNPFRAMRKPTQTDIASSNRALVSSKVFQLHFRHSHNSVDVEDVSAEVGHKGYTINPDALASIGCFKYYGFLRVHDYPNVKSSLRTRQKMHPSLGLDIHGIYGVHDLLVGVYEGIQDLGVVRQLLRLRLWPAITSESDFNNEHLAVCRVTKVFKHRGRLVSEFKPRADILSGDLAGLVEQAVIGPGSTEEQMKSYERAISVLKQANAIIPTPYDTSDVSDRERNEGKVEFLVVVRILQGDHGPQSDGAKERFEQGVMASLLNDPRVRTIESIESDHKGYFDGDYMLHVVGHLRDLNDIVVGVLQSDRAVGPSDHLATRVILTAESVGQGRMTSVIEPRKVPSSLQTMLALVEQWMKLEGDQNRRLRDIVPTSVLMLSEEDSRKLLQGLYLAERFGQVDEDWIRGFHNFSYASAVALGGVKLGIPMPYQRFKELSRAFVLRVGDSLESSIRSSICSVADNLAISRDTVSALCNDAIRVIKNKTGSLDVSTLTLGSAEYLFESLSGCVREKYREAWLTSAMSVLSAELPESSSSKKEQVVKAWAQWVHAMVGTSESLNEFKRFITARNQMAHDAEEKNQMSPRSIFGATFEGMRAYDRLINTSRAIRSRPTKDTGDAPAQS